MNGKQRSLRRWDGMIGFSLVAVLLSALVCADPAAAQCGPSGTNTACGSGALASNTSGFYDSAYGFEALFSNTMGFYNTASGAQALFGNTTGNYNTASGDFALFGNTMGGSNTASGYGALFSNTSGNNNNASGVDALYHNITGNSNTASGDYALFHNIAGNFNTASGDYALAFNIAGNNNAAHGNYALYNNTTGNNNTASGDYALYNNTTGRSNIGLGYNAGNNIVGGSNNIDIGGAGPGDEFNTIRIGNNNTQNATYIAGISGTGVTGNIVEVTSSGQLGVTFSSARYKRDIHDMGGASTGLMKLRPVSFRYKSDPNGTLQYGLVAEEVERVYPELVVHGTDGKVQSVRYLELTALLLNELQKQTTKIAAQQHEIDALKQKDAAINALSERLAALEQQARTANPPALRSLASK
jgi:Chaperone of endosialidase